MVRIFGAVGKAGTRIMTEAVLAEAEHTSPAPVVVVLSPDADENGIAWSDAKTALAADTIVVLNADGGVPAGDILTGDIRPVVHTFGLTGAAGLRATDLDATLDGT